VVKGKTFSLSYIYITFAVILFSGCAGMPRNANGAYFSSQDYISINSFCANNNATYSYDTIDDIIRFNIDGQEARFLINSKTVYLGGNIFYIRRAPRFFGGKLYMPKDALKFLDSEQIFIPQPSFVIKTIVIDPGHGGKDPGAISASGVREKDVNLKISGYLKSKLEALGFKVFLTRQTDVYPSLSERAEFARRKKADLFISVHANANKNSSIKGAEVYYLKFAKFGGTQRALRLARESDFPGKPYEVKSILWDMLLAKDYFLSVEASHIFYNSFYNTGIKVRPPITANFHVLRNAYIPAVLIETGYLTNKQECELLNRTYYQKQIAEAIALGVSALSKRYNR